MSLLDALHFLKKSWDNVSEQTIINCFRKAKFCLNEGPEDDSPEEDQLERFDDDDLPTCAELDGEPLLNDEVNEIDVNETSIDENIESYSNISCKEVLECFYKLKGFFNQYLPERLESVLNIEEDLYLGMDNCKKQRKITDFFKKN